MAELKEVEIRLGLGISGFSQLLMPWISGFTIEARIVKQDSTTSTTASYHTEMNGASLLRLGVSSRCDDVAIL
jgi:hypothetical protein